MRTPPTRDDIRAAVYESLPQSVHELAELIRIPGVAFDGFDHTQVHRSAEAVAQLLRDVGMPDVRIVEADGQPAVLGRIEAPPGAPTVLLYAHHDVQPTGDRAQWRTEPFEPVTRGERLYGRGAADDKAGVMVHVTALRALRDQLGVGVVVFVEGEEEYGSASLERLLLRYRDDLRADVIVIADSTNWDVGTPALTTSLRGLVNLFVRVQTLDHAVHSGMFGGAAPDALTALCRLVATLHDNQGEVAVAGLLSGKTTAPAYSEERFRAEAGVLDGVDLIGVGPLTERLWTKPAVAVLGIDAPATGEAPSALVPEARAKLSIRIAPGEDPQYAYDAVCRHLSTHAPWGAEVSVEPEQSGAACVVAVDSPVYALARAAMAYAWDGVEPVDIGVGGSIPFISTFQELFPDAAILVTAVADPDSRAHGPNESVHLGEFARAAVAEAVLLAEVAGYSAT